MRKLSLSPFLPGLRPELRALVQLYVVSMMLLATWRFHGFYRYVMGIGNVQSAYRPPVGEGLMPLGAITAFRAWLATGDFDPIHPAGLVIFIATLITAWIFRRALCSWICPVGTLFQYVGRLGNRVMGRNLAMPSWLDKLLRGLKYAIGASLIYTLFFKLTSAEAVSFLQLPYYVISDFKMFILWFRPAAITVLLLAFVLVMSFLFKSFWCRYLCPYGAVLGLIGLLTPITLKKDPAACVKCGKCSKACPNLVNVKDVTTRVLTPECTGCTSCVRGCPKGALQFRAFGVLPVSVKLFSLAFLAVFFGAILLAKYTGHWESIVPSAAYKAIYQHYTTLGGP